MASFFFEDYHFPNELYNRDTCDFTTPIRTLLDFAPHILQQLPKEKKDQKPIHSDSEDSWTKMNVPTSYIGSLLSSERVKALAEFAVRYGNEYMKSQSDKRRDEENFKRFEEERKRDKRKARTGQGWFFSREEEESSSEDDSEEEREAEFKKRMAEAQQRKAKAATKTQNKTDSKDKQAVTQSSLASSTLVKSAAAASVLSLSLYSTYQASMTFSDITFHNQLEILTSQVQSIIQSTEIWIKEHEKLNDKVPSQVRTDVIRIKQLIDLLVRLDPRTDKKIEAAGWGCGALGGLSALGGFALGSAAVATGGAALALGGAVVMISSKAHSSGKSKTGARILLESQVREKVAECQKSSEERELVIQDELKKKGTHTTKEEKQTSPTLNEEVKTESLKNIQEEQTKPTVNILPQKVKREKVALTGE